MGPEAASGRSRAVSSVVGVVLMVAITVLLSAVVGVVSVGVGENVEEAPTVRFDFEPMERTGNPDELRVTHAGGEIVSNTRLYLVAGSGKIQDDDGTGVAGQSDRFTWYELAADDGATAGADVEAGASVVLEPPDSNPELDDRVIRVVWSYDGGDAVLARFRGPDVG